MPPFGLLLLWPLHLTGTTLGKEDCFGILVSESPSAQCSQRHGGTSQSLAHLLFWHLFITSFCLPWYFFLNTVNYPSSRIWKRLASKPILLILQMRRQRYLWINDFPITTRQTWEVEIKQHNICSLNWFLFFLWLRETLCKHHPAEKQHSQLNHQ